MKYIPGDPNSPYLSEQIPTIELTRRNLTILLEKLDDPESRRSLIDRDDKVRVMAVEDAEHYSDRPAGVMYMPSTGEYR